MLRLSAVLCVLLWVTACYGPMRQADRAYEAGRYEEALAGYQARLATAPQDGLAALKAGRALRALGRLEEARTMLKEARRLGAPGALVELGRVNLDLGDVQGGADALAEACTANLDDPSAWNALGVAYQRLGRGEDAETALLTALRMAPDVPEIYLNLAVTYDRLLARPVQAYAYYACYAALQPEEARERMVLWRMGVLGQSAAIGSKVMAQEVKCPERASAGSGMITVDVVPVTRLAPTGDPRLAEAERLFRSGLHEQAAQEVMAAQAKGPLGAAGQLLLGLALMRSGDPFKAVPRLLESVRLDPNCADAWYELGWAYEMAGDSEQATETWKAASTRFPFDPRFVLMLRDR